MQQKIQKAIEANPKIMQGIDSGLSYAGGGGLVAASSLADMAEVAQQIGIILGCLVIAVKLIYDVIKLIRFCCKKE